MRERLPVAVFDDEASEVIFNGPWWWEAARAYAFHGEPIADTGGPEEVRSSGHAGRAPTHSLMHALARRTSPQPTSASLPDKDRTLPHDLFTQADFVEISGGLSPRFRFVMLEANIKVVCCRAACEDAMARKSKKSKQSKKPVKKLAKKAIKKAKKEAKKEIKKEIKKEEKKSDTDTDRSDVKPPSPFSS